MKEVFISVVSLHAYGTDEEDRVEFSTDGVYQFDGEVGRLDYFETEVTGMQGTRTCVFIYPDKVIVDRQGTVTSRMEFSDGSRNSFIYNTPYGDATLSIKTRRITRDLHADGGRLELEYVIDVEHAVVARNKFIVEIKEQKLGEFING